MVLRLAASVSPMQGLAFPSPRFALRQQSQACAFRYFRPAQLTKVAPVCLAGHPTGNWHQAKGATPARAGRPRRTKPC